MLHVFDLVKPKLKDVGNCFVNLGDTYSSSTKGNGGIDKQNIGAAESQHFEMIKVSSNIPDKCLCMIHQRFAWGMIEHGWILRNEIIWHKPNHMPESVTDRLTKSHEAIYHFVKQGKYYYDLDAIREPFAESSIKRITQPNVMNQTGGKEQTDLRGDPISGNASRCNKMVQSLAKKYDGKFDGNSDHDEFGSPRARTQRTKMAADTNHNGNSLKDKRDYYRDNGLPEGHPLGKNPGDVWQINTQPYSEAHFAVFPLKLVEKPILAGCPKGGMVLDMFGGSGTVAEFCRHNERECTIIELNDEYKSLIKERSMDSTPTLQSYPVC
jgi:DNA modification methylase